MCNCPSNRISGANLMILRWVLRALAVAGSLATTSAFADPITFSAADVGKNFSVDYIGPIGQTAAASFTLTSVTDEPSPEGGFTAYRFAYSIANSSDSALNSAISGLEFNVSPDLVLAGSLTTNMFTNTALKNNQFNTGDLVDFCISALPLCQDAYSGLAAPGSEAGAFMVGFAKSTPTMTFDDFFLRYQTLSITQVMTSATATGTISSTSSGGTPVPEPDTLVLFSAAVAAVVWYRRRGLGAQPRVSA
jgi:hypothetical protein